MSCCLKNKMFPKLLLVCFLLATATSSIYASEKLNCIDPAIVAVSGLLPGMEIKSLNSIDNYLSKETVTEEDDGGYYEAHTFRYEKYDITIVRGMIDSIRITSPDFLWVDNIKIGADRNLVEKQITSTPVVDDKDSSQYVVCSNVGDVYTIFRYDDNRVKSIELIMDRP